MIEGWWIFPLLGVAAGIMAGLLGIGGGLVLVAALVWLFPSFGVPQEAAVHTALATSMAAIIFTGTSSTLSHNRRGSVQWRSVAWLVPGMLVGGWLGSLFAQTLDGGVLKWCVAVYCWIAGAQMAFGRTRAELGKDEAPVGWPLTAAGGGIGAVSAVVGIGGGSMTVPYLVWRGVAPVRAVGSSAACGVFIALAAAAGYAFNAPEGALPAHGIGYVFVPAAIGIAAGSMLAAPLGTRIAHAVSGPTLRKIFAVFMLLVGTSMVL